MKHSSLPYSILTLLFVAGYLVFLVETKQVPCIKPIGYALTTYDERFSLPRERVQKDLLKAASVWNTELGREVLFATAEPDLPVIFAYTKTQTTVDTLSNIEENIEILKSELTTLANEYGTLKKQYDALNAQGKATREMYDKLQTLFARYEALRKQVNANIAQGQKLPSGEIEEGKYTSDQNGTRVTIYAYQDEAELVRTLTHELGHALGLDHVENKESIMYPTNARDESLVLSNEDKAELTKVCTEAEGSLQGKLYTAFHPYTGPVYALAKPYAQKGLAYLEELLRYVPFKA